MDEVEFHAPPRESKSKRWLSFHPFSGIYIYIYTYACTHIYTTIHSRGLTRSDLDDTCFKSTLAFSHAFHMC